MADVSLLYGCGLKFSFSKDHNICNFAFQSTIEDIDLIKIRDVTKAEKGHRILAL